MRCNIIIVNKLIEYNFLTSKITLDSYYDSDSIDKNQLNNIHIAI